MGQRIVVDTNILISALGWRGLEHKLLNECFSGKHTLCLSIQILHELIKVMDYPKFKFTQAQKDLYLSLLQAHSLILDIPEFLENVCEDKTDIKFIECAVKHNAAYLISGDQHLLKLKNFNGIPIIKVSEFYSGL